MDLESVNKIIERRQKITHEALVIKGAKYAVAGDHLYNFKEGALRNGKGETSIQTALGYYTKHWVGLTDLINQPTSDYELEQEYLMDLIVYLHLTEALFEERRLHAQKERTTNNDSSRFSGILPKMSEGSGQ